ncbi:rhomboid-related protein 3 isoform X1, partial [Tachysurus ichikawai]
MIARARANSSPAVAAHTEGEEIEVLESEETETGAPPDT